MPETLYDAVVIGGGPGGSTAATYLARAGKKVLILEKESFPRFHIGESLLPYNCRIFQDMGIMPLMEAAGFPKKFGAQFHLGNARKSIKLVFSQGKYTREPMAFQVERSKFDHLLLKHAQCEGTEVREGWTVTRFISDEKGMTVEAHGPEGKTEAFRCSFLIDASGRGNLTGNQEKLRVVHPKLKKLAVFGHFSGVRLDPGDKAGDTVIVRNKNKWFWLIPVSADKTSVGCVVDQEEFNRMRDTPARIFNLFCRTTPAVQERMEQAELVGNIQATSDFSYYNRKLVGPRLLRVGDAAGFMDPIFSAGVYLAMFSGRLAAQTVLASLAAPGSSTRRLLAYEKRIFHAMRFYWRMVEEFYTTPFMEVLLEPREKFNLTSAVNAALAGEVEGGWALRWRMRLFFWIVRLQARYPLVPRIYFDL